MPTESPWPRPTKTDVLIQSLLPKKKKRKVDKAPRAWLGACARRSRAVSLCLPVSPRVEGVIALAFLSLISIPLTQSLPPSSLLSGRALRNLPILSRAGALGATRRRPFPTRRRRWFPGKGFVLLRYSCFSIIYLFIYLFSSFGRVISCLDFTMPILSFACVIITQSVM